VQAWLTEHLRDHYALYGEDAGVRSARKHIGWAVRALPGGEAFRAAMNTLDDCEAQLRAVTTSSRPWPTPTGCCPRPHRLPTRTRLHNKPDAARPRPPAWRPPHCLTHEQEQRHRCLRPRDAGPVLPDLRGAEPHSLHDMVIRTVEKPLLEVVMQQADGNQSKAAEWLGINRNTLRRKLVEHKLIK
jgi:DNA-binding protein Fis